MIKYIFIFLCIFSLGYLSYANEVRVMEKRAIQKHLISLVEKGDSKGFSYSPKYKNIIINLKVN